MTWSFELLALIGSALLLLSILASKVSSRLGLPALLLFLVVGMLAGSDGPGRIPFDNPALAQSLGVVALVLILFSGGLDTDWRAIRPVLGAGVSLATIGVTLTAAIVGGAAVVVLGFSWLDGLLLGAIVSSTDAAAVFAILRARDTRLKGNLESLIEFESGSNDPMAVVLTLSLIQLAQQPDAPVWSLVGFFVQQMVVGAGIGHGLGRLMIVLLNRIRLEFQGLYPALTVSLAGLVFSLAAGLGGNGFLAVYLAALTLGQANFIHRRSLRTFHDGLAWIMQIVMFLTLGLQVFPSRLWPVAGAGLLLSAILLLLARPLSVTVALALTRMGWRERALVSWGGLRGAAPIILATFPYVAGLPSADLIFHLVFFIVLTSVLLQGTTLAAVGRRLGLEVGPEAGPESGDYQQSHSIDDRLERVPVPPNSPVAGRQIVELGLPPGALIVLVERRSKVLVPSGGTVVQAGDVLLVLADADSLAVLRSAIERAA